VKCDPHVTLWTIVTLKKLSSLSQTLFRAA
jgi:hypothetical protein